jgi:hypothetical protein
LWERVKNPAPHLRQLFQVLELSAPFFVLLFCLGHALYIHTYVYIFVYGYVRI